MKEKLVFLLLISLFCSCVDDTSKKETKYLANIIDQSNIINKQYRWIVILPGTGCHGCIQEGEYFLKNNIDNDEILFVLTKLASLKILQQKIEVDDLSKRQNVYVDKNKEFFIPSHNNIYPCVIYLKNGRFVRHSFQSSISTALYDLEKEL